MSKHMREYVCDQIGLCIIFRWKRLHSKEIQQHSKEIQEYVHIYIVNDLGASTER